MRQQTGGGFTLIELLVSTGIMITTVGMAISGYGNFNKVQKVKQAALSFKNNLRYAQLKATSAQKPSDYPQCDTLLGYQVKRIDDSSYFLRVSCVSGNGPETEYTLPDGITFRNDFDMVFRSYDASSDRVIGATTVELALPSPTKSYKIIIQANGNIVDGNYSSI